MLHLKGQGVLTGATDDSVILWNPVNGKDMPENEEQVEDHVEFEESIHLDESIRRTSSAPESSNIHTLDYIY